MVGNGKVGKIKMLLLYVFVMLMTMTTINDGRYKSSLLSQIRR